MPKSMPGAGQRLPYEVVLRIAGMLHIQKSAVGGMRLRKNQRPSDFGIGRKRGVSHTDPVKHTITDNIDTTGARDPSRIRQARTKAYYAKKRELAALVALPGVYEEVSHA